MLWRARFSCHFQKSLGCLAGCSLAFVVRDQSRMPNDITKQLIECLRSNDDPFFLTDTQFVSGDFLLTVLPNIESETVRAYRLEFPADERLDKCPYPFLILAYLFDIDS